MSSDLNSLIANYLSENSNASSSDVIDKLHNLGSEYSGNLVKHTSIFSYGDTADEDELLDYFSSATGENADTISDDVALFFDILDQDGNGSLSDDELQILKREYGMNKGNIDGFSFFNDLISIDESEVQALLDTLNESKAALSTTSTTSSDTSASVTTTSSNTSASVATTSSTKTTSSSKSKKTSSKKSSTKSTSKSTGISNDSRIKTDSKGNNYVLVEKWVSGDSSRNSCLYYIIKHSYDFDKLGVSYSSAKEKLLAAIVAANNISNPNLVYTNQKIILPDAYKVLGIE